MRSFAFSRQRERYAVKETAECTGSRYTTVLFVVLNEARPRRRFEGGNCRASLVNERCSTMIIVKRGLSRRAESRAAVEHLQTLIARFVYLVPPLRS